MPGDAGDKTAVQPKRRTSGRRTQRKAVLMLCHADLPLPAEAMDRIAVGSSCTVGRGSGCDLTLADPRISQAHFRIFEKSGGCWLEDLGSTNGTFLQGSPVARGAPIELESPAIVRAGDSLLVFVSDGAPVLEGRLDGGPPGSTMAGRFHVPALVRQLMEAALSHRAPLLAGPSGVGKELAAGLLARLWGLSAPRRYNVAASANPEEMSRMLFGVAARSYTGVAEQPGLIVSAGRERRPLFLDEVHHLSAEAQATLLTVLEDGKFSRKGAEDEEITTEVRFVFASNEPDKLKHDLRARLWRVDLPTLRHRLADVPDIFKALLGAALDRYGLERDLALPLVDAEMLHEICLEVLRGSPFAESNVRGLQDLAERIAARIVAGASPDDAIDTVLEERLSRPSRDEESSSTHYERHRELISAVYLGCGKNAKRTVELLREAGVPWTISRRHLTNHVEKWGLK